MRSLTYRLRKSAVKCIFPVIGVVLFTVQVSYKFFVFASQPLFRSEIRTTNHFFRISANPASPNVHNDHRLLLDKRYELKHVFALLTPLFELNHYPGEVKSFFDPCPGSISFFTFLSPTLRGPPSF